MRKTIVLFSNPFGYGPTGKAIAIANALRNRGVADLIFASGNFVAEIVPSGIRQVHVNERDIEDVKKLLSSIENPIIVSSQNRFAIKAGKELGVPTVFLDGLAWLWKEIPADHLIADDIFWMKYPGIEKRIPSIRKDTRIVEAIVDASPNVERGEQILIHIGGCENPLVSEFPSAYLDITLKLAQSLPTSQKLVITGGKSAIEYLLQKKTGANISCVNLLHDEFIEELSRSSLFLTTAGQTATLEAFSIGVPTQFLLPMNSSQRGLTEKLKNLGIILKCLDWKEYVEMKIDLENADEKAAIQIFQQSAKDLLQDAESLARLSRDFKTMVFSSKDTVRQNAFIRSFGIRGAEQIADFIIDTYIK